MTDNLGPHSAIGPDSKNKSAENRSADEFEQWPASKFKDPLAVEHGIKLPTALADLANNWWSKRWLAIIDAFGLGVRMQRARMYATRGQVLSLVVEKGLVKALVQGTDPEPYRVIIAVKMLPQAIWQSILNDLGRKSHFGISIASGTLPPEEDVAEAFKINGALLFPDRQGELQTKCSCLDWANPCKHIAAIYLLLTAEFDRDPFLIFKLRGLSIDDLFALMRQSDRANGCPADEIAQTGQFEVILDTSEEQDSDPESARVHALKMEANKSSDWHLSRPAEYWKSSITAEDILGPWQASADTAALPSSLGEFPFWQGRNEFLTAIRHVYEKAPAQCKSVFNSTA